MAADGKAGRTGGEGYDPIAFSQNVLRLAEAVGRVSAAWMAPRERNPLAFDASGDIGAALKAFGRLGVAWMSNPLGLVEANRRLLASYADLWTGAMQRATGAAEAHSDEHELRDRRFRDPEWTQNPFFDFLRRAYFATTRWADDLVRNAEGLDGDERMRADFYVRQVLAALSPSNFVPTNPELLRRTIDTNGENLVRGMSMLAEDIEAGGGTLKIRQADLSAFKVGENLAVTPGKVVHRNAICELIQYTATTKTVLKRPLLIVPPWINKFYVLDLSPEKSFIRWAVDQGHSVFVISWVNPDERQAGKDFEAYLEEGVLEALDVVGEITGSKGVNAVGYCVGGTLLSVALAHLAAIGDTRIKSATLFATQVDFTHAGDLKVFAGEDEIAATERQMEARGYLEGGKMANAFNMLRPNDLIWPYVVSTYLMGDPPSAFDLLYWNADSTRMPAANHSFYLRACYLENRLAKGEVSIAGTRIDLRKVKVPVYNLGTREDHIAPARSVLKGNALFGGPTTFVVAGSGHIAGVINPPSRGKYQYWTDGHTTGDLDRWYATAKEHPGSWWPHWQAWIEAQDSRRVPARKPGGRAHPPMEDAPGSYVRVMA